MSYFRVLQESKKNDLNKDEEKLISICKKFCKYDYINKGRTLSSSEFIKQGGGICYDFVNIMHSAIPSPHKCLFICNGDKDNTPIATHTFILVDLDNSVYWVECSWRPFGGVMRFNNFDEAISFVIKKHKKGKFLYAAQYTPNSSLVGITIDEFITKMASLPEYKFKYIGNTKPNKVLYRKI